MVPTPQHRPGWGRSQGSSGADAVVTRRASDTATPTAAPTAATSELPELEPPRAAEVVASGREGGEGGRGLGGDSEGSGGGVGGDAGLTREGGGGNSGDRHA